jgi:quercetin dioxygenase-like cupin family protein
MNRPESAADGVTFELASIARELRATPAYAREGHTARTLIRAADQRVTLVALRAGNTLSEHQASATASLQVLSGQLRVQLPERTVALTAGQLLVLGAGLPHDVHAQSESAFLLTLGWPARS